MSFKEIKQSIDYSFNQEDITKEKKLLPIGYDLFGNYLCIRLIGNKYEIIFFDHEEHKPFYRVSNSISEMLKTLTIFESLHNEDDSIVTFNPTDEFLKEIEEYKKNKKTNKV